MKKVSVAGALSVGITWVDGSTIFKPDEKWSQVYYGICNFSTGIFAFAPIDFKKVTMLTTIEVSPKFKHCDRSKTCVHFDCELNRFDKESFYDMFKDAGGFTLGMPQNFGEEALWFNLPPYSTKWRHFIIPVHGGTLIHKDRLQ